uniref:Acyl-coenzyme A thioesterase 8 n=1 Tax=Schistocephalus solidus TaxID=70667 RepID=A0A0X3QF20_SCHSO
MATGDSFIGALDISPLSDDTFAAKRGPLLNSRTIYGGELMAQALMVAQHTVPPDFDVHSMHCYFLGKSSPTLPNAYKVQKLLESRSFSHRTVEAYQLDENRVDTSVPAAFRMECSFKAPEEDAASFVGPMPKVLPPQKLGSILKFMDSLDPAKLTGVQKERLRMLRGFAANSPMEVRFCEPALLLGLEPNSSGRLHAWMRLRTPPSYSGSFSRYRNAMLAYFSDGLLLWVNVTEPRPVYFMVTLSQSIWFHNPSICPEPTDWLLMETRAQYVGGTLTLSFGSFWDTEGNLLASMSQQGLLRTTLLTPVPSETSMANKARDNYVENKPDKQKNGLENHTSLSTQSNLRL